jgi:aryl-alcohol dehydrogenase-like predicted oxidoreductase
MNYRTLGRTGMRVSAICLGTMQFGWTADESQSLRILSAAREAGVNFIDTADIYSRWAEGNPGGVAEQIVGRWLKESGIARDQVVIATKVRGNMGAGPQDEGLSRGHILSAVENSLRRLRTDVIDLYQVHWPDENVPIDETLRALDDLVQQGKVRYLGASNFPAWRLMQALWSSERGSVARFESLQPHYNLVHRDEFERELAAVCQTYQLAVLPYSPLAGGFLTGKYRRNRVANTPRAASAERYYTEQNWKLLDVLGDMAKQKQASLAQVALAWLLVDPLVTSTIIGANSLEQLKDNLGAVRLELTPAEKSTLDECSAWNSRKSSAAGETHPA